MLASTALLALIGAAQASPDFDPTSPMGVCTGDQAATHDGAIPLWSAIEHHRDPGAGLLTQEDFNTTTRWADNSPWAPWIGRCFGSGTPPSSDFLLHLGPREASALGTPVLFVPGAGDNGSRGFIAMATRMDNAGRPVYSMTFAHPHGDLFQQAEAVANAISRVQARTGAAQVDVVAHSKGTVAAAVYASNHAGAGWGRSDYATHGTAYRDDIRRLVLIAAPLGGVDTSYRWPSSNLLSLDADTAMAPVSWDTYYPYGSATWLPSTDLSAQDLMAGGDRDLFPGQRQLLARWDDVYGLPGANPTLGAYALQQDWFTTYEGGLGFVSHSDGIDAALAAGDGLLTDLARNGVDPDVEIFLLAGDNPLMHNGAEYLAMDGLSIPGVTGVAEIFVEAWAEMADTGADTWAQLVAELVGDGLVAQGLEPEEVQGLVQGKVVLGEISGPSDGVIFVESALDGAALTARGARIIDTDTVNLSHLDLLYASPITGQILIDAAAADPVESGWQGPLGERYVAADTLGWVEEALADEREGDGGGEGGDAGDGSDGGDGATDGGSDEGGATDDSGLVGDDGGGSSGGGTVDEDARGRDGAGCAVGGLAPAGALAVLGLLASARRRESA